jgi:hypothetical protein
VSETTKRSNADRRKKKKEKANIPKCTNNGRQKEGQGIQTVQHQPAFQSMYRIVCMFGCGCRNQSGIHDEDEKEKMQKKNAKKKKKRKKRKQTKPTKQQCIHVQQGEGPDFPVNQGPLKIHP